MASAKKQQSQTLDSYVTDNILWRNNDIPLPHVIVDSYLFFLILSFSSTSLKKKKKKCTQKNGAINMSDGSSGEIPRPLKNQKKHLRKHLV